MYFFEIHIESAAVLSLFPKILTFVDELVFLILLKNMLRLKLVDNCPFLIICFGFMYRNNFGNFATIRKYTKTQRKVEIIMQILSNNIGGKLINSNGMSSPPTAFLDPKTLITLKISVGERGLR